MRYLLDTHALIWAGAAQHLLSRIATAIIVDKRNVLLISAVSAWEIATKVRMGRLPEAALLEGNFVLQVQAAGYVLRPITVADGLRAGRLQGQHKDPWDRMLAAQALEDGVPIISIDAKLDGFGVRRIWE